jgi:hypothetical protein
MVTFIGDVGEAAAARSAAQAGVDEARTRARQLLEDARRQGERLVSEAQQRVSDADQRYAEAFDRAVEEGWAVRLLTDLGYTAPDRRIKRLRPTTGDRDTAAVRLDAAPAA